MSWELFNVLGISAFAISGAIIATEEKYDLFGAYVLGLVTAFGGGVIRNALIGLPTDALWKQELMIYVALIAITLVLFCPSPWFQYWKKWLNFFDAIGLAAFSIQGALYATDKGLPLVAVIFAAVMTGIGGGLIRDVLAGRKPLVLQKEIYALWSVIIGVVVGLHWVSGNVQLLVLCGLIVALRMVSTIYGWHLPGRIVHRKMS
ncbi:trimeric intracellular cation channel family protein [Laceyella putida]|uniref:Trimeric intracellular cation channel family protein n=1 Tax=Laceyella putida TaxID=110101 RepID=A0ABW2RKS6_9BACL